MDLTRGARLGPYEIISPLGAGGMGEVFKARDTRLDRYVAIKVLPEHLAGDARALARFEREAKAVAALNHPNILGIYDFANEGELRFVVMELLEGESLHARLAKGPLSARLATDLAIQLAQGLAAAHEKGVIHRDLTPANLWVTRDGRLKILDFGLARQTRRDEGPSITHQGAVLGTPGYMSPEQVRGEEVDARTDIFSFGAVFFEMLTGRRAFVRSTSADTLAAILQEEPEPGDRPLSPALRRILDHCLEKVPARRFHDAQNLAFALENLSVASTEPMEAARRPFPWRPAALALGLLLAGAGGLWGLRGRSQPPPSFQRLTFEAGTLEAARFGSDGKTVYFSMRVGGAPPELYVCDPRSTEPKALGIPDAMLLGVSPTDELAVLKHPRQLLEGMFLGTLTQVPGGGGAQRALREGIVEAVWDGAGLATLSTVEGLLQFQLEFPVGRPLATFNDPPRSIRHLALSRDGNLLACVDGDFARSVSDICVFDRKGARRVLYTKAEDNQGITITGLAWGPGRELWGSELQGDQTLLWALPLGGTRRILWRSQGNLQLLDVSPEGRALLAVQTVRRGAFALKPGAAGAPRELSLQGRTQVRGISADGRQVLLSESPIMDGGTVDDRTYLRSPEGGPPLALGIGFGDSLSRDGRWVNMVLGPQPARKLDPAWARALEEAGLARGDLEDPRARSRYLLFVPTGLGRPFAIPIPRAYDPIGGSAYLLPDGQRAVAHLQHGERAGWVLLDRRGAPPVPLAPEGNWANFATLYPLSSDGTRFILSQDGNAWFIANLAGGPLVPIRGVLPGERVAAWSAEGNAVFVRTGFAQTPVNVSRLDLATAARRPVLSFNIPDPAGYMGCPEVVLSPDARSFALSYRKALTELYLVDGLASP
ncbi:serine/threonine-protein kinase [Geothrix sp. 21YS21S-2]|uniref:serine/threonine-protein kinase n=1 Tax=Geothrix sp. 21YS21S-2 TaxID=3068893 RepID=UPI0027BAA14E|nr:serine/threonine-protein kinase [Geothrix sp. 21YS21S-2]